MISVIINPKDGDEVELTLPVNLTEIKETIAENVEHIHLAENQSIVAICYHETLPAIVLAGRQKKQVSTPVVPLFVKTGRSESDFINNIKMGDKIVVSPSQLAIGHHLVTPYNKWSLDRVFDLCTSDKDFIQKSTKYKDIPVYFVEFKVINNFDIVANYSED